MKFIIIAASVTVVLIILSVYFGIFIPVKFEEKKNRTPARYL